MQTEQSEAPPVVLRFSGVTKTFVISGGSQLLSTHLAQAFARGKRGGGFTALENVSFSLRAGEGLAVVGSNGAGKSTLLSIAAGVCFPDKGRVEVAGRVAALLELGSGFQTDLTGRENVFLNASLLGMSKQQVRESYDTIVDFAGIAPFIDEPLRTYSSGMVMRLAFSIAVHLDPEILIVDEVLAVGDKDFQAKCYTKIHNFREQGKTFIVVSHAARSLTNFCDRAIWLDHGRLVMDGPLAEVLARYESPTSHEFAGSITQS
jgi:ABC-type polysaccharide/polyol phosphate transport system ATPase subunit